MRWLFGIYRAQFGVSVARYLAYRLETHIWLAQIVLRPIIFMVVWATVARASGGSLGGYTPSDFAAYFIIAMVMHHLTLAWGIFEWEPYIRTGDLSILLVRPCNVVHKSIAEHFTFKALTTPFILLTGAGLAFAFRPTFDFAAWSLAVAVPAVLLAIVLYFLISWMMGMLSFWTTEIEAIITAFNLAMFLFSGQLAPMSMSPPGVQFIASLLPFWSVIGFPTELILGNLTPQQAMTGLLAQAGWVSVTALGCVAVYRRGVRTYSAVGL